MPRQIPDAVLLDAALAVFIQQGYAGATTREIAEAAGVSEVTLFRRFGSKSGLLKASLEVAVQQLVSTDALHHSGDLEADLTQVVRFYRELALTRGRLIAVIAAELPRHPELADAMAIPQRVIGGVAALLERYQREGQLEPEPPLESVAALLGPLMVVGMLRGLGASLQPSAPEPAVQVRRFLSGRRLVAQGQTAGTLQQPIDDLEQRHAAQHGGDEDQGLG